MTDLPAGSYLMSEYHDGHRGLTVLMVYYEDGRVEMTDAEGTLALCLFTPVQVAEAKDAIRQSGLLHASDLDAEDVSDAAAFTYRWLLDGEPGAATNSAYPARKPPAFEAFTKRLDALEQAAGCGPDLE